MEEIAIGIDIGGTKTAIGLVTRDGKILAKDIFFTPSKSLNSTADQQISDRLFHEYIKDISQMIGELAASLNVKFGIAGIGIGAPNGNFHKGTIEYAANLPFIGEVELCKMLSNAFSDVSVIRLTNDANAAALGEKVYGGASEMDHFVMYTLGTGVGSGLYSNGGLVYGYDGFAGECGHNTVVPNGRLCGCGGRGHLETYCSASGMKRTAFELLSRDNAVGSLLSDYSYNEMTSKHIYEAAVKGDEIALEVFKITGTFLGQALADTVHHISPEAIFLFGGPVAAGNLIIDPIKESLQQHLLPVFQKRDIPVLASKLKSGEAAILGASALVW